MTRRIVATLAALVIAVAGAAWSGCGGEDEANDQIDQVQDQVDKATDGASDEAQEGIDKAQEEIDQAQDNY